MTVLLDGWSSWIEVLGWTLLHFLWQGALIGAGFAAIRALLPRERCDARYAVGLSALALLALCPLATFVSLYRETMLASAAPAAGPTGAIEATNAVQVAEAVWPSVDAALPWLVLLWGVGVLVVAARALHQWRSLAKIVRHQARPAADLEAIVVSLARRFGLARRVRVLVSACIETPTLIGWIKPVVLLPTAVALGFPRQQVELILAHELGHLCRCDHLANLAQSLLEILFFYHPVVRWISREVRNERELCCDALVLRLTSGAPRDYALALASLEELRQPVMQQVVLAASGGVLLDRIRRIVGAPMPRQAAVRSNSGTWLLVAMALCLAVATVARLRDELPPLVTTRLAADWLARVHVDVLPIATLRLPLERPRLRVAAVPPPPEKLLPAPIVATTPVPSASTLPTEAQRSPAPATVGAPKAAIADPQLSASVPAASVQPAASPSLPAASAAPLVPVASSKPQATAPVATRVVQPTYPAWAGRGRERIELGFETTSSGSVRGVHVLSGNPGSAFARASILALSQWRFDPATVSSGKLYTQAFVFAPQSHEIDAGGEGGCIQSTGSHICRNPNDAAPVHTVEIAGSTGGG